uniref:Uncharacterized protein n=1 Tax=Onchocerca volvulus TaxID=6282 RepID=A0A8R1TZ57_ONCVO
MLDIKIRQIKIYNSSNLRLKGGADVLWSLFNGDAPLLNNKNLSPPPYTPHAPNIYVDIDVLKTLLNNSFPAAHYLRLTGTNSISCKNMGHREEK